MEEHIQLPFQIIHSRFLRARYQLMHLISLKLWANCNHISVRYDLDIDRRLVHTLLAQANTVGTGRSLARTSRLLSAVQDFQ